MWSNICVLFSLFGCIYSRPNVLFLMADDLRVQLAFNQDAPQQPFVLHPGMLTPHLDQLASQSAVFHRAYVQQSVCNPSRASALTSRRPDTTKVYGSDSYFRTSGGNFTTIPQYFKDNGYLTLGMGKIFHSDTSEVKHSDPISWSEPFYTAPNHKYWKSRKHGSHKAVSRIEQLSHPLPDRQVADKAREALRSMPEGAQSGQSPFFLAVGFHKPHLPWIYPVQMHQHYPLSSISLPNNCFAPVGMPAVAWHKADGFYRYSDIANLEASTDYNATNVLPARIVKKLRRAYYSSVTYVDSLVGELLAELDAQGLRNNTIITFWSDHGWHLGEHGAWSKQTNFEMANRVPMLVSYPPITNQTSININKPVEMVDLFPTLTEMALSSSLDTCPENSRETQLCSEGRSLLPLILSRGESLWKEAAFSQFPRSKNTIMGYSMKTHEYRYTAWVERRKNGQPNWNKVKAEELYDHTRDPEENFNRVAESYYGKTRRQLQRKLRRGWRYVESV
ncbi:hypothetical protein CAPTEDRAFT_116122 [Capitella teleta]|uniref:Sulfatase N-terminal domain-containing protein n=1 Tax=Capitella teleta TaxID=283909 RepID=R7TEF4_CAPTE|nr:hypothetical protein CAPTEDRAFT_116122 [Capitella teleta]|eukprot:ELT89852.1 hypothetical protein CAPTEDRAFT_116122 [Capitella teleta]